MMKRRVPVLAFGLCWALGTALPALAEQGAGDVVCNAGQVCRVTLTKLPLLALSRPYSNLYKSASAEKGHLLRENMPAFYPLYVFARPPQAMTETGDNPTGWYQVGTSVRNPIGWMQAKDVFEWRQALVVAYKHPGTGTDVRQRVVMFDDLPAVSALVEAPNREARAREFYEGIGSGKVPQGIVSIEPNRFADIDKNFYMFPILDFKDLGNRFDDPAHYLLLAAAVPGRRAAPGEAAETVRSAAAVLPETVMAERIRSELQDLAIDVVFLIDMTASMGPYIEHVRSVMTQVARTISRDEKVTRRIRFGLVGYRDNSQMMPGLEWTTKNFTPQFVSDLQFVEVAGQAQEAGSSSNDYPEEVYAGFQAALDSKWRENSIRFLVHIGDASPHEPGHPQATTGNLDARALRLLADDKKVRIFSIHLRDARAAPDWPAAQAQFEKLSKNAGVAEEAYFDVPAADLNAYDRVVKNIAGRLADQLDTKKIDVTQLVAASRPSAAPVPGGMAASDDADVTGSQIAAALIEYLGKEANPPRDIKGWAFDRDLIDPRKSALDVRVLMSRADLDNLIIAVGLVLDAMKEIKITKQGLFDTLQALSANVLKDRDDISFQGARNLAETRLLPGFIASLPYKSAILSLTPQRYAAMTNEEVSQLEITLKSDLTFYRELYNSPELWKKLNDDDADADKVHPVSLYALP